MWHVQTDIRGCIHAICIQYVQVLLRADSPVIMGAAMSISTSHRPIALAQSWHWPSPSAYMMTRCRWPAVSGLSVYWPPITVSVCDLHMSIATCDAKLGARTCVICVRKLPTLTGILRHAIWHPCDNVIPLNSDSNLLSNTNPIFRSSTYM